MESPTAVIIGAGPAGLTAAWQLLLHTRIRPVVLEESACMGGISRTVNCRGNRLDMGGHRFFSKSQDVMDWWQQHLPAPQRDPEDPLPEDDAVMLLRHRSSRIYFLRKLFPYPVTPSPSTFRSLGLARTLRMGASYGRAAMFPIRPVRNLEEFFINRFGRELYRTFFQSYTEKVWGVPCSGIDAAWGEQRIKGLSLRRAAAHFFRGALRRGGPVETSLIDRFLYPKFGPGQMWETVAAKIRARGGRILTGLAAREILVDGARVTGVRAVDAAGRGHVFPAGAVFSSMPVQELLRAMRTDVPREVSEVGEGLVYRDFLTVGLLVDRLLLPGAGPAGGLPPDQWIYIQEPGVLAGRLQIFNNWSPAMVADPRRVWLGVEYFCQEGDGLWSRTDAALADLAAAELDAIGLIDRAGVLDSVVARVPKAYPAYFGSYGSFHRVRSWLDRYENLFPIGRNGMHRYNNQDHSMLTAMAAVENLACGRLDKSNIWSVNAEQDYNEAGPADA